MIQPRFNTDGSGGGPLKNLRHMQRLLQQNVNHIRQYIWNWYSSSPIGSHLSPFQNPGTSSTHTDEEEQLVCTIKSFNMQEPSENLLNVDGPLDVLYPGSFVQSRYVSTGAESLVSLSFPQDKRYNIRIFEASSNFAPVFSSSPSSGDVQYAIKEALKSSSGFVSGSVFYDLFKSTEINKAVIKFNFNQKILRMLDLSGSFSSTTQTRRSKYVLTMLQKLHTVGADLYVQTPG